MPIIDRGLPLNKLRKERNRSSKVLVFAIILIAVLILGAIPGLIGHMSNTKPLSPETPVRVPARIAYITHSPISIIGNGGFTNASGVVWGSGTESDPYIIEGWDINASTANGIDIRNTDAHFAIRNCRVHDGGLNPDGFHGVRLEDCANGTLDGNNCSLDNYGIFIKSSRNITITDNSCGPNNFFGISLWSSSVITIHNNNLNSNTACGMSLAFSDNTTVSTNNCSSNSQDGIDIVASRNNILANNNCSFNIGDGIYCYAGSGNNTLSDNTCSYNSRGMDLQYWSTNNTVSSNNCSHNEDGIRLLASSNNNTISDNIFSRNTRYGLYVLANCSNNRIWNNTFSYNNGSGDSYDSAHVQAYDDGGSNRWNSTDGDGNYWSDWTSPDSDANGVVDSPYVLDGTSGAKDYYPLTTPQAPIPEFGMVPFVVMVLLAAIFLITGARRRKEH